MRFSCAQVCSASANNGHWPGRQASVPLRKPHYEVVFLVNFLSYTRTKSSKTTCGIPWDRRRPPTQVLNCPAAWVRDTDLVTNRLVPTLVMRQRLGSAHVGWCHGLL